MNQKEVKSAHAQVSKATGASEGLRILARMIARHLLKEKPGMMDGQRPSGCRPDISDVLTGEEASDA